MNAEETLGTAMGIGFGIIAIYFLITILFLLSQSSFAKAMKTKNEMKNTSGVWIWTQLIPIWSLIAIPITLIKLNEQFRVFSEENELTNSTEIKQYNNTWGWIWFGGSLLAIFVPFFGIVALIGIIGFWIHISGVKNNLLSFKNANR